MTTEKRPSAWARRLEKRLRELLVCSFGTGSGDTRRRVRGMLDEEAARLLRARTDPLVRALRQLAEEGSYPQDRRRARAALAEYEGDA